AAPGARAGGERLRLELELTGNLRAEPGEQGHAIVLKQEDGEPALRYSDLSATDAEGRALPSQMRMNDGRVYLEVDDTSAVYPVTIDPTFAFQGLFIDINYGQDNYQLGYSVAINGGGNIAVIGAPYDDIGSNVDQGSAYVFARDSGGWSQRQKLTASDGAAYDYFGYSVAVGGAGGSTIVIGAPFDDVGYTNQGSVYVFVSNG